MAANRSLFRRVRLDLGSADRDRLPSDERLAGGLEGAVRLQTRVGGTVTLDGTLQAR